MQNIKVRKADLLTKLKDNRKTHKENYDKAVEVYKKALVVYLQKMLARAEKGKKVTQYIDLVTPTHNLAEYDRIIAMLEMTIEEEIELTEAEFTQYVLDNWTWKGTFALNTLSYSNFARTGSVGLSEGEVSGNSVIGSGENYASLFKITDINIQDAE